jgi:hypothetical protein
MYDYKHLVREAWLEQSNSSSHSNAYHRSPNISAVQLTVELSYVKLCVPSSIVVLLIQA